MIPWYRTEEKVPERGDRIMLIGNKLHPHDVTANLIYDMDFFRDLQTLEEYVWEPAKRRYQYWCYMDDLMKDAYGEI